MTAPTRQTVVSLTEPIGCPDPALWDLRPGAEERDPRVAVEVRASAPAGASRADVARALRRAARRVLSSMAPEEAGR